LQVIVHELATHAAVALATPVEQTFPHVPQSLEFVVVSTQVPLQSDIDTEQPETHVEFVQTGVPPSWAHARPQAEQLFRSVARFTHTPLQRV
jgi:hypothetical protein